MSNWIKTLNFKKILLIFLLFKVFDFIIIIIANYTVPYLGFFPYKENLLDYKAPFFLTNLANFDGVQYLIIAKDGYHQFQQAFFPLFPLLIRFTAAILHNHLLAGIIISNISGLLGTYVFYIILKEKFDTTIGFLAVLLLLSFPTSFFFGAVYATSLFFMLLVTCIYSGLKRNYFLLFLTGFLASLTSVVGVLLVIPIFFILLQNKIIKNLKLAVSLLFAPILGLLSYCIFLYQTTGDPFYFYHTQPIFGAQRSTHLIIIPQVIFRYIKIFLSSSHNFQYLIALIEFIIFILFFLCLIYYLVKLIKSKQKKYFEIGFVLFSLANITLPTLTGTFSSIPRYALFSLSLFIFLSMMKNKYLTYLVLVLFSIFHVILLSYFSQGYFVS